MDGDGAYEGVNVGCVFRRLETFSQGFEVGDDVFGFGASTEVVQDVLSSVVVWVGGVFVFEGGCRPVFRDCVCIWSLHCFRECFEDTFVVGQSNFEFDSTAHKCAPGMLHGQSKVGYPVKVALALASVQE